MARERMALYTLRYELANVIKYETFSSKKKLEKTIKELPKKLEDFSVCYSIYNKDNLCLCFSLINQTDISYDYIKSEKHEVVLK